MTRRVMGVKRWALGTVLMAMLLAAPGWAQEDEKGSEPFKVSVNVISEYTDNRDSVADGESNFDLYLQPRIDAVGSWDQGYVDFYYQPSYRYRSDPNSDQNDNALFHDVGVDFEHRATELLKFRLKDNFNYTDDPSVQKGGATVRADSSFIYNTSEGGITVGFSRRTWFDFYGRSMIKRYTEDEVAQDRDEDSIGSGAQFWHQMHRQLALALSADWVAYSYENTQDIDRGFATASLGGGLEADIGKRLRAAAKVGWQEVSYEDDTIDNEVLPMASLRMRAGSDEGSRVVASLGYAVRSSDVYPYASQKSTDFSVRAEWAAVPETLTVGFLGAYQLGEYESDTVPESSGNLDGGDRTVLSAGIELAYLMGDKVTSLKVSHRYDDVDSDVDGVAGEDDSFTKNTMRVTLSRQF